jgi:hypothetical protein
MTMAAQDRRERRGHPHDSYRGYRVKVGDGEWRPAGTVAAVMVIVTRELVDLDGKLEIQVQREQETR